MTREMALEYGDRGIFVNALAPGTVLPPEDYSDVWQRIRERCRSSSPCTRTANCSTALRVDTDRPLLTSVHKLNFRIS